jgi:hypothetical protein
MIQPRDHAADRMMMWYSLGCVRAQTMLNAVNVRFKVFTSVTLKHIDF